MKHRITFKTSSLNLNLGRTSALLVPLAVAFAGCAHAQTPAYKDPRAPLETRVADLMSRLTDDEKISLLGGHRVHHQTDSAFGRAARCDG